MVIYQLLQAMMISGIVGISALYTLYFLFPSTIRSCRNWMYSYLGWEHKNTQPISNNIQHKASGCNSQCTQCSGCSLILFKR